MKADWVDEAQEVTQLMVDSQVERIRSSLISPAKTMKAEATSWIVILLCFLAWAVDIAIIYVGRAQ